MASSYYRVACGMALASVLACGPKVNPGHPPRDDYDLDDPMLALPAAAASPGVEGEVQTSEPVRAKWGSVRRADLLAVLDQGPAAFLAGVELSPYFREQRFEGWKIVKLRPGDPRFAAVDLQPGDVVTAVNGREIMKPQHFFDVWSELRAADEIVVTGQRSNTRFELRFQVVDGP